MPKKKLNEAEQTVDLLQKSLVFQMFILGAPQGNIAKVVARKKAWVNELLKGLPKGGRTNGSQAQSKKAKKRSRR